MSDVDRLFIIPPAIEFAADTVNAVLTAAKQSKVNHVIVLSAPSGGIPPTHKYVCSNGSFYYIEKKVNYNKPCIKCQLLNVQIIKIYT